MSIIIKSYILTYLFLLPVFDWQRLNIVKVLFDLSFIYIHHFFSVRIPGS